MDNESFNCEDLHCGYDMMEQECDFCGYKYQLCNNPIYESCCDNKRLISDAGRDACTSCGTIDRYHYVGQKVFFYNKIHLISRMSSYKLKYYVRKMILKYNMDLTWNQLDKIVKISKVIGNYQTDCDDRKRVIHKVIHMVQLEISSLFF